MNKAVLTKSITAMRILSTAIKTYKARKYRISGPVMDLLKTFGVWSPFPSQIIAFTSRTLILEANLALTMTTQTNVSPHLLPLQVISFTSIKTTRVTSLVAHLHLGSTKCSTSQLWLVVTLQTPYITVIYSKTASSCILSKDGLHSSISMISTPHSFSTCLPSHSRSRLIPIQWLCTKTPKIGPISHLQLQNCSELSSTFSLQMQAQ